MPIHHYWFPSFTGWLWWPIVYSRRSIWTNRYCLFRIYPWLRERSPSWLHWSHHVPWLDLKRHWNQSLNRLVIIFKTLFFKLYWLKHSATDNKKDTIKNTWYTYVIIIKLFNKTSNFKNYKNLNNVPFFMYYFFF